MLVQNSPIAGTERQPLRAILQPIEKESTMPETYVLNDFSRSGQLIGEVAATCCGHFLRAAGRACRGMALPT
jgi:hypothetical protein